MLGHTKKAFGNIVHMLQISVEEIPEKSKARRPPIPNIAEMSKSLGLSTIPSSTMRQASLMTGKKMKSEASYEIQEHRLVTSAPAHAMAPYITSRLYEPSDKDKFVVHADASGDAPSESSRPQRQLARWLLCGTPRSAG